MKVKVFVDTSAFYAGLCTSDRFHLEAVATWKVLLTEPFLPITSNYV